MSVIENLLKDRALIDAIIHRCESGHSIPKSIEDQVTAEQVVEFLRLATEQGRAAARANFPDKQSDILEKIVEKEGRPAILIENNTFDSAGTWQRELDAAKANLEKAVPAVGRVEMTNHDQGMIYSGSGWLVAPDVVVTNRHVAEEFSLKSGSRVTFRVSATGKKMGAKVDFREENGTDQEEQFDVLDILYLAEPADPDIAFLKISSKTLRLGVLSNLQGKPISLATTPTTSGRNVAAIGYPSRESATALISDADLSKIFGDVYNVKRLQPGKITAVSSKHLTHDCSTLGGNSGSVVIDLNTGEAVGLHFGGQSLVGNFAIPSQVILDRMRKLGL